MVSATHITPRDRGDLMHAHNPASVYILLLRLIETGSNVREGVLSFVYGGVNFFFFSSWELLFEPGVCFLAQANLGHSSKVGRVYIYGALQTRVFEQFARRPERVNRKNLDAQV